MHQYDRRTTVPIENTVCCHYPTVVIPSSKENTVLYERKNPLVLLPPSNNLVQFGSLLRAHRPFDLAFRPLLSAASRILRADAWHFRRLYSMDVLS